MPSSRKKTAMTTIAVRLRANQASWVCAMPTCSPNRFIPARPWGSRYSMTRPTPPIVAASGSSSWSPRCPRATSATCAPITSTTYTRAMPSGPGSALFAATILTSATPSGTSTTMGRRRRSSVPRQVRAIGLALKAHPDLSDRQLVPVAERHRAVDPMAVDVRAVGAPLVLDEPGPAAKGEHGVRGAREVVLDEDRAVDVAPDGVDRPQRDRTTDRRLILRRLEHGQPADPLAGCLLGSLGTAQVTQQRAAEEEEEQVEEPNEGELEDEDQDPQGFLGAHPPTPNSSVVSPIWMTSPGPSATSCTGCPLTVDPLRLPRSAKL